MKFLIFCGQTVFNFYSFSCLMEYKDSSQLVYIFTANRPANIGQIERKMQPKIRWGCYIVLPQRNLHQYNVKAELYALKGAQMLSIYPMSHQERNSRVTQTYKTCQTCTMKEKAVSVKLRVPHFLGLVNFLFLVA